MGPMSVTMETEYPLQMVDDEVLRQRPHPPAHEAGPYLSPRANRVLIYTTCYNVIDGVTLTIRKLEKEILSAGGHVCILTTKSGDAKNTNLEGTHPRRRVLFLDDSIPVPFYVDPDHPENQLHVGFSLSRSMVGEVDEFGPTVVHVTVPDCTGLCVVQYARDREIPLMGTYHSNYTDYMDHYPGLGWLKPILENLFRHQYNFYQGLYVPTPFVRRNLIQNSQMDRVTDLGIWGRGVDLERFHPRHRSLSFRREHGIADDAVVLCFAGRLVAEKSLDIFASVVRRLAARGANFHALVIGCGPWLAELRSLPQTTCVGWLSGGELAVAYASSDAFLFPSSVETFGNVTLEAAASGLPLVVEAGCSGHLVEDGSNGYACPAGDHEAFFRASLRLVEDAHRRREFSARSRAFALTLRDRDVLRGMLDVYGRTADEFYDTYGGQHRNRDAEVKDRGWPAFKGGMYPRPLGLVVIERIFIGLFRLVWWMLGIYAFLQKVVLVTLALAVQDRASLNRTAREAASGDNKIESERTKDYSPEQEDLGLSSTSEQLKDTASSDDEPSGPCCSLAQFGDGPYARKMALALVDFLAFQWRMSSRVWEALDRRGRPSGPKMAFSHAAADGNRKRKDSDGPFKPHQLRARSNSDGSDGTDSTRSSSSSSYPSSSFSSYPSSSRDEEIGEHCRIRRAISQNIQVSVTI